MYVLHDLNISHGDLSAQIDFIVVTRKFIYIIECKNLLGNIEIRNTGDFIRTFTYNGKSVKEGIYSPITQNERHIELIRQKRLANRNGVSKFLFEKHFDNFHRSIVVLANQKTVMNDRYALKTIKSKIIKADQLIRYIKETNLSSKGVAYSDKDIEAIANEFSQMHTAKIIDYKEKYLSLTNPETKPPDTSPTICPACGKPLVKRKGKYGSFLGCEGYPKCKFTFKLKK